MNIWLSYSSVLNFQNMYLCRMIIIYSDRQSPIHSNIQELQQYRTKEANFVRIVVISCTIEICVILATKNRTYMFVKVQLIGDNYRSCDRRILFLLHLISYWEYKILAFMLSIYPRHIRLFVCLSSGTVIHHY